MNPIAAIVIAILYFIWKNISKSIRIKQAAAKKTASKQMSASFEELKKMRGKLLSQFSEKTADIDPRGQPSAEQRFDNTWNETFQSKENVPVFPADVPGKDLTIMEENDEKIAVSELLHISEPTGDRKLQSLLSSNGLVHAVIMQEILGRPKSLR